MIWRAVLALLLASGCRDAPSAGQSVTSLQSSTIPPPVSTDRINGRPAFLGSVRTTASTGCVLVIGSDVLISVDDGVAHARIDGRIIALDILANTTSFRGGGVAIDVVADAEGDANVTIVRGATEWRFPATWLCREEVAG